MFTFSENEFWIPVFCRKFCILQNTEINNHSHKMISFIKISYVVIAENTEVVVMRCSVKKVLLKILQHLHKKICARVSFFIKLQASRPVPILYPLKTPENHSFSGGSGWIKWKHWHEIGWIIRTRLKQNFSFLL